jgi:hypothetical protein
MQSAFSGIGRWSRAKRMTRDALREYERSMPLAHTVPRAYTCRLQDKNKGGLVVVDRHRPAEEQLRAHRADQEPSRRVSTLTSSAVPRARTTARRGRSRSSNRASRSCGQTSARVRSATKTSPRASASRKDRRTGTRSNKQRPIGSYSAQRPGSDLRRQSRATVRPWGGNTSG